ncbi:MAG: 5-formyltetrahydrofolate cyclo-ligase [Coriobacteriia bacterium]|nr:5-formyltetrahydrofolate cyclo-ligase [Coriobacteriia bacterium]
MDTPSDIAAEKSALRARMRLARRAIDPSVRAALSSAAAEQLLALPEIASVAASAEAAAAAMSAAMSTTASTGVVLAYSATAEELDPAPALEVLRARGVQVALPRVVAAPVAPTGGKRHGHGHGLLTLHLVADPATLLAGHIGILEPPKDAPRVEPVGIDAIIVPGVAFDAQGHRLGQGGGYYDRLLPAVRSDCLLIGYAFDEQLVPEIPCETHDMRVDVVITPSQAIRTAGRIERV